MANEVQVQDLLPVRSRVSWGAILAGVMTSIALYFLLSVLGVLLWLVWPAKPDSRWKLQGPIGRRGGKTVAELRAELEHDRDED